MTTSTAAPYQGATVLPTSTATPRGATRVRLTRLVGVELCKTFDTRSGLWLLVGLGVAAVLTSGAVIAWAPREQLTHSQFTLAIGMPMSVILPTIAALSVTSEWNQRTGLTTFTLVPHRGRVLLAKALAAVGVAVPPPSWRWASAPSEPRGLRPGRRPGRVGHEHPRRGLFRPWPDAAAPHWLRAGSPHPELRRSRRRLHALRLRRPRPAVLPRLQREVVRRRPALVDPKHNQDLLLRGEMVGDAWTQLAVTVLAWLVLPMAAAVLAVLRSEVK